LKSIPGRKHAFGRLHFEKLKPGVNLGISGGDNLDKAFELRSYHHGDFCTANRYNRREAIKTARRILRLETKHDAKG